MTNDELRQLLEQIHALALKPYPFPDGPQRYDPRLVMAIGQIAGIAARALNPSRAGTSDKASDGSAG